ncbi:H+-translocating [NiFe] hydrogenase complex, transmembrane subunit EchA [Candidatus Desulfovibrio trichonymphae]|uniref:H+-translocating [NiFe] hydrogenase complex, transmembrane subunit EchA n=2 Tax=Candidatus Desulfovibrio trichonymphae TaxID=1725232 RepID=A0A1J1DRB9_9BACT|nr:H+-translocating [NiFe] hydrogenase complex, transmembrane subunit EchA [Candidatus Desulfovibrio trichonymphae]
MWTIVQKIENAPRLFMLTLYFFCAVLALLVGGAFCSLATGRAAAATAACACVTAGAVGLCLSLYLLLSGATLRVSFPLPLPLGECLFCVDRLSSVFLPPVFLLALIGGALLPGRLKSLAVEAAETGARLAVGRHCFFFCFLIAGMVMTITAADAVLFLISWEIMSLMPFFLISPLDRDANERFAVWVYLTAAHLGVLPLLLLFAGMGAEAGGTDFVLFAARGAWSHPGLYFILALVGFGLKAGLVPLHVWMPEAHSSAPGHVAVLLSGAMLNVGLYGILRVLLLAGPPETWWAYALMGAGVLSGVTGILLGLVQSDIKRTLAYSSAENMGIICLALGGALLAYSIGSSAAALLLTGVFLHIWNHSLFKSLLFLAANAVKEHTHTMLIQRLGGLHKRIPFTGGCFALGSAAIAGIPPLNGFMSELLLYTGFAVGSKAAGNTETALLFWGAFFVLGAIAGMALFAFTQAYGLAFLGAPKSAQSYQAREPETLFKAAMLLLALLCLCAGFAGPLLLKALSPFLVWFASGLGIPLAACAEGMEAAATVLAWYAALGAVLLVLFALVNLARGRAVGKNGFAEGVTWSCGYCRPTARMQYTGGAFARTFAMLLHPLARTRTVTPKMQGLFPGPENAVMTSPDWPMELWSSLLFRPVAAVAEAAKNLQTGLVNLYILYIFIALVATLTWALGWA